jgi:hypothetical protein
MTRTQLVVLTAIAATLLAATVAYGVLRLYA